uniref:Uncharacterized protein n=1 Tax=Caldiarchaeum subterraneum TaxID=311458 RepID=E6N302_CALS0|nr:hypothetical protein HGMM_F11H10C28 [Candidatus Caldarchaeum subterraneum]
MRIFPTIHVGNHGEAESSGEKRYGDRVNFSNTFTGFEESGDKEAAEKRDNPCKPGSQRQHILA